MHRFYVPPERIRESKAWVRGDELRHLARVLRLETQDPVIIFDGLGQEYQGVIISLTEEEALVQVAQAVRLPRESPLAVWLVQGLPKGDKMEWIIQKTTELGIRGIVPLEASRSIVKLTGKKRLEREDRWRKVATEAAKQCRRALIPAIGHIQTLTLFLQNLPPDCLLVIPWEEGGRPLKKVLEEKGSGAVLPKTVYILIGPEGGLEESEVALAQSYGGIPVTLGPRILRTETAGLITAALFLYQWGDLGG